MAIKSERFAQFDKTLVITSDDTDKEHSEVIAIKIEDWRNRKSISFSIEKGDFQEMLEKCGIIE